MSANERSYDKRFMQRAIELARRGEGLTRPNPPVGAVLVQNGRIIGEGWHEQAGGPHAEAMCLKNMKPHFHDLATSTLYITLEPCSTFGRTPPCTNLILKKGIGRVVIAVKDLNPCHAGRGLELLRHEGVQVVAGVCEEQGHELIVPFEKSITTGLPFVTLKLALTLDGKIADHAGGSKWITGEKARERVQAMRRRADAVMVGAGTVRADDPSLLPRPDKGREPWRVVIGEPIPKTAKVLTDEAADRTLLRSGDLKEVLKGLAGNHDVMHVLCEGGADLATRLIENGLVDEYAFFVAPKLMGTDGLSFFNQTGGLISNVLDLRFLCVEQLGEDILIKAKPEK